MSIVHVKQTDRARVRQKCETSKYGTLALPKYSPWCATNRILLLNTCFGQVYLGSLIKIWKSKGRCHKKDMLWQTTKKITKGCQHHHGHIHQQAIMFICTMHMEFARREEFTYECECARISTNLENFVGKYLLLLKRREGPPTVVRPSNTFTLTITLHYVTNKYLCHILSTQQICMNISHITPIYRQPNTHNWNLLVTSSLP